MLDRAHARARAAHRCAADRRRERRQLVGVLATRAAARPRSRRRPRTGATAAIASATLSAFSPPDRITGTRGGRDSRARAPSENVSPVPPRHARRRSCRAGGSRCGTRASAWTSAPLRTRAALITLQPVRRAASAQNAGPSSPCSWSIVSPTASATAATSSSVGVDEHADDLGPPLDRGGDLGRGLVERAAPRRAAARRSSRSPTRRRSTARCGVVERGDAAELDPGRSRQHIVADGSAPRSARGRRPRCRASASAPRRSAPRRRRPPRSSRELRAASEPGFGDDQRAGRDSRRAARTCARVSTSSVVRSRLLIPIDAGAERRARPRARARRGPRPARSSPSSRASSCSARSSPRVERGDDQQDRVGAGRDRLVHLVGVDDEVLAQERQADGGARRAQIVERAAEAALLGQHRQRRGAAALVGARRRPRARGPRGSRPADGERRLCSAITDSPGRASASRNERSAAPAAPRRRSSAASGSARGGAPTLELARASRGSRRGRSRRQLARAPRRTARASPPRAPSSIARSRRPHARRPASRRAPPA